MEDSFSAGDGIVPGGGGGGSGEYEGYLSGEDVRSERGDSDNEISLAYKEDEEE